LVLQGVQARPEPTVTVAATVPTARVMLFYLQGTCSTVESQRAAAAKAGQQQQSEDGQGPGQDAAAAGGLYSLLDERYQSIVAPFLTTKFTQSASKIEGTGQLLDRLLGFPLCGKAVTQKCSAPPALLIGLVAEVLAEAFHGGHQQHNTARQLWVCLCRVALCPAPGQAEESPAHVLIM
jgi:hypothetical protein